MVGLFRPKREEPVEQLSPEALCARLGLPQERPAKPDPSAQRPDYLRVDGPQPTQPRSWRAGVGDTR